MSRRNYKKPPIQEALVEFTFVPGTEWDFTTPARVYDELREAYSAKPTQQIATGVEIGESEGAQAFRLQQNAPRTRFGSEDQTKFVMIADGYLSVHRVGSYPGWKDFQDQVHQGLDAYLKVTGSSQIAHVGVRYINRIELPSDELRLTNYFVDPPTAPSDLSLTITNFLARSEMWDSDKHARVGKTFGSITGQPGSSVFILDVDIAKDWTDDALEVGDAREAIQNLRALERDVFEALITDQLRGIFDDD